MSSASVSLGSTLSLREGTTFLEVSDTAYVDGDYARAVGYVVSQVGSTTEYSVFVDLDLAREGRLERLINEAGAVDVFGTPTANQYAQWVDSDTIRGIDTIPQSAISVEEVLISSSTSLNIDTEAEYNTYANVRILWENPTSSFVNIILPSIAVPRDAWVMSGDLFEVEYSTASVRDTFVVDAAAGDTLGGTQRIILQQGEFVRLRVPQTGNTWEVVATGFAAGNGVAQGSAGILTSGSLVNDGPFVETPILALGADGAARANRDFIYNQKTGVVDTQVYLHTSGGVNSSNPRSFTFDNNYARIAWWNSVEDDTALDIGQSFNDIIGLEPTATSWIEDNINNGYTFEVYNPDVDYAITDFVFQSGNTIRCTFSGTLPAVITVDSRVTIEGATDTVYNGLHLVSNIQSSHFDITIPSITDSSHDESGSSARGRLVYYCQVSVATHSTREYTFSAFDGPTHSGSVSIPTISAELRPELCRYPW